MKKEEKNVSKEIKRKEMGTFIKKHIFNKTKILSSIGIILFFVMFIILAYTLSNIELDSIQKITLIKDIEQRLVILILIILAGWVAYFYLPAIAFGAYIFMLASDMALAAELHGTFLTCVFGIIPILIDIFTTSIITSIGIYMCIYSTKKRKYLQKTSFSFLDIKMKIYQMAKQDKKYEEAVLKKQETIEKMEENNVKIDYKNIFRIAPIVIAINIIVCIIEHYIIY